MKSKNLLLTSVLTASVLGLFGAVLSTSLLPESASARDLITSHMHGGAGRWGHSRCGALNERAAELASAYVSITLDLDDAQQQSLVPVIEVLESWHEDAASLCNHDTIANAPQALGEIRGLLDKTQLAFDELIPAFEAFYATLTPEQQARLNGWVNEHHGSRS